MELLKIKRSPFVFEEAVVSLDPDEVAKARKVVYELLDEYRNTAMQGTPAT